MQFFRVRQEFYIKKLNDSGSKHFRTDKIYPEASLDEITMPTVCDDSRSAKMNYLRTGWIDIAEPSDIHELIKMVVLNEK